MFFVQLQAMILLGLCFAGCSASQKVDVSKLPPPPTTQELVEMHNARIQQLDTLWARVSVRAKGTYDDGQGYEEQGEGHLQIQRPDRISLSIGKLGETYFVFGANPEQYWSFNLADSENRTLLVGDMELATRQKTLAIGLPVHPSDLIALSGVAPIDLSRAGGTAWGPEGKRVGLRVPARWGTLMLWFDPDDARVLQTQAIDSEGRVVANAELSRYKDATIRGGRPIPVPGKIEITTPNDSGYIRIEISEPQNKQINSIVFDPERLQRRYRVGQIVDLDAEWSSDEGTP